MNEQENDFKEDLEFSHLTRQNILYRMAQASKDSQGFGFLIDYEVTMKLLAKVGKEPLIKRFGKENTEAKIRILKKVGSLVSNINFYLHNIDHKNIKITDQRYIQARKGYVLLVEYLDIIYEIFYILLDASPLKNLSIPHEYLADKKTSETGETR